jgi:hypothetical protein
MGRFQRFVRKIPRYRPYAWNSLTLVILVEPYGSLPLLLT